MSASRGICYSFLYLPSPKAACDAYRVRTFCGTMDWSITDISAWPNQTPSDERVEFLSWKACERCNEIAKIEQGIFCLSPATQEEIQLRYLLMKRLRYGGYKDGRYGIEFEDGKASIYLTIENGKGDVIYRRHSP
jgi:hypothetical protein